jgi:flagella basal body P-ring formation protein FlgA
MTAAIRIARLDRRERTVMGWPLEKLLIGIGVGLAVQLVGALGASADERPDEFVRVELEEFLRDRAASPDAVIEIPVLDSFAAESVGKTEELRTRFSTRAEQPFRGRVAVNVELLLGDRLLHSGVVSAYLRIDEKVFVPVRPLRRGEVLGEADFRSVARDASRLPFDTVREREQLLGRRMTRSLRADEVLRASHVERVPVVGRGDRVTLVLESGAIQISSIGRAVEAGAVGDWIRVLNVDSRRELSGRVGEDGRVHVAF